MIRTAVTPVRYHDREFDSPASLKSRFRYLPHSYVGLRLASPHPLYLVPEPDPASQPKTSIIINIDAISSQTPFDRDELIAVMQDVYTQAQQTGLSRPVKAVARTERDTTRSPILNCKKACPNTVQERYFSSPASAVVRIACNSTHLC
jgi:hypothetical protein